MAFTDDVLYGVIFALPDGPHTMRGFSSANPKIAAAHFEQILKKNPEVQFNLELGKGLFKLDTQDASKWFDTVEESNRVAQAKAGKLSVEEFTGEKQANRVLEQPWLVPGSKIEQPEIVIPSDA